MPDLKKKINSIPQKKNNSKPKVVPKKNDEITFRDVNDNMAVQAAKMFDPTGITSYPDIYYAAKDLREGKGSVSNLLMNIVGALPMVGKAKTIYRLGKAASASKTVKNTVKVAKAVEKAATKANKATSLVPLANSANMAKKVVGKTAVQADRLAKWMTKPITPKSILSSSKAFGKTDAKNLAVDVMDLANVTADAASVIKQVPDAAKKTVDNTKKVINYTKEGFKIATDVAKDLKDKTNKSIQKNVDEKVREVYNNLYPIDKNKTIKYYNTDPKRGEVEKPGQLANVQYVPIQNSVQLQKWKEQNNANSNSTNSFADGGQINNNLNIKYNNYLNNNMKRYAEGGTLNQFNVGGSHEQNPNGGILQGPNATVEQGETSIKTPTGKYIYSDRLYINEDLAKQFNLPSSIRGKTFADASKIIDKPFKDKNSNPDKMTHKEHLDRLKQAQETLKAEEAQKEQAIMQNAQQSPGFENQQVPEGMEEFAGQQEMPQEGMEQMMQQPGMSAYGGFIKKYESGGNFFTNPEGGLSGNSIGGISGGLDALGQFAQGNKDAGLNSLAKTGLTMGANALLPGSGAFVSPLYDLGSSLVNANKNKMESANKSRMGAMDANSQFSDKFAEGGYMNYFRKGGILDSLGPVPLADDLTLPKSIDNIKEYQASRGLVVDGDFGKNSKKQFALDKANWKPETPNTSMLKPKEQPFVEPTSVRQGMEDYYQKNKNTTTRDNQGNLFDRNAGKILKYAPIGMNAYQLSQLKKPSGVVLDRLSNRYKPNYMDESRLQNQVSNEMNNTIAGLTNASAGSESALRANLVGATAGRIRGMSDAYAKMNEYNAGQDSVGQQFNLGVDQFNIGQSNNQLDINDRNQANYRNQKSKLLGSIGTDLGSVGKEEVNKNQLAEALGYTWDGRFYVNNKTGEKKTAKDLAGETTTNAYGGYLKMNKIGRR